MRFRMPLSPHATPDTCFTNLSGFARTQRGGSGVPRLH